MNNIIAINIIKETKILNANGYPILFYWDGETTPYNQIIESAEFFKHLQNIGIFSDFDTYTKTRITYISFADDDPNKTGDEFIEEKTISIQEAFPFKMLFAKGEVNDNIYKQSFNYLYNASFKSNYDFYDDSSYYLDIYRKIKDKFGDKLSMDTFVNALRNFYKTTYPAMSESNINYIMSNIKDNLTIKY